MNLLTLFNYLQKDSQQHREFLVDKGKLWVSYFLLSAILFIMHLHQFYDFPFSLNLKGIFKDGYGKLINLYCRLLVVKLDFHRRNPKFPGNLMIKDEEIEAVCEHDVNL
jgi:hypothetical protein